MSHFGVTPDLSLGRPSSTMGRPIFSQKPLSQLDSPNSFYNCLPHLEFYVKALEDERQKIDAFKRELPICMQLLDDAIEASRDQLAKELGPPLGSTSLQISCASTAKASFLSERRGAEEFAIWKANWEKQAEDDEEGKLERRLWDKAPEPELSQPQGHWNRNMLQFKKENSSPKCMKLEFDHNASSFESKLLPVNPIDTSEATPARDMSRQPVSSQYAGTLSINGSPLCEEVIKEQLPKETLCTLENDPKVMTAEMVVAPPAGPPGRANTSSQQPRKARRCWSPELHQRFLHALHHLGGPQVATPKQIRELMNVDGLTNDEVKSHLQKFRLHTRRPMGASAQPPEQAQHAPQLVVFGGIWVPPDYTAGNHTSPAAPAAQQAMGNIYDTASSGHAQRASHISPSLVSHATNEYNAYFQSHHQHRRPNLVCQNLMQQQQQATFSEFEPQDRMEAASEEDVARSESTSLNGETGRMDDQHDEEDTEIHLGSREQGTSSRICRN